jgi:opacity protein-like surface antigen
MIMTMIKRGTVILFALLLSAIAAGQTNDYGIWYEAKADKKIWKGLRADFETSIRTNENARNIEKFYFEPGLRYKFNDYFNAGIYYRFIGQEEKDGKYHARHRWFAQIKVTAPSVARFTFGIRYRIQQQFMTYIEDPEDEDPQWYQRVRLELDYDIRGIPLRPYVKTETQLLLFDPNEYTVDKWRTMFGVEYTLNKKHTFGLEYIYNDSRVTKPPFENLLGITYSVSL